MKISSSQDRWHQPTTIAAVPFGLFFLFSSSDLDRYILRLLLHRPTPPCSDHPITSHPIIPRPPAAGWRPPRRCCPRPAAPEPRPRARSQGPVACVACVCVFVCVYVRWWVGVRDKEGRKEARMIFVFVFLFLGGGGEKEGKGGPRFSFCRRQWMDDIRIAHRINQSTHPPTISVWTISSDGSTAWAAAACAGPPPPPPPNRGIAPGISCSRPAAPCEVAGMTHGGGRWVGGWVNRDGMGWDGLPG